MKNPLLVTTPKVIKGKFLWGQNTEMIWIVLWCFIRILNSFYECNLFTFFVDYFFSLSLEKLREIFDREQISVDILAEMNHEDLKQIGVIAYGHRHKLIKGIEKLVSGNGKEHSIRYCEWRISTLRISTKVSIITSGYYWNLNRWSIFQWRSRGFARPLKQYWLVWR